MCWGQVGGRQDVPTVNAVWGSRGGNAHLSLEQGQRQLHGPSKQPVGLGKQELAGTSPAVTTQVQTWLPARWGTMGRFVNFFLFTLQLLLGS